jgi:DNA-binding SARP family transcriptional activator
LTPDSPTQLRIHLLGQPRFTLGDEPLRLNMRPRCLPLLAYLLLHRDRPIARTTLALVFWADESEESARTNLRRHLHEIGNALPPSDEPWITTTSDAVGWNSAADVWLDVEEFERLANTVDGRAPAVETYGGDLLENSYDECLFAPRERLRAVYLSALYELVVERRAARRFTRAVDYAQRILAVDPWREDVVRQLISARYESGDRAGALQTFDHFARTLREELDVDPMPETVSLRDAVLRNTAVDSASTEEADPHPQHVPINAGAMPFVGRAAELEQLAAAWSRAARGRGSCFLVGGEAGVGKTRLAAQLAQHAEAEGARVMWGTTSSPERAPYEALVDALRNALPMIAATTIQPVWLAALVQLLPELALRRPDVPPLAAIDPERERTRLFEAIAVAVEALAAPRPVVLVLEDLHWADSATIAALEFIVQRIGQRPIFILGTYRDEETPRPHPLREFRRRLQPQSLIAHLALGRLTLGAVEELVARSDLDAAIAAGLAPRLYEITEGNPLLLGEAMRLLAEGRSVEAGVATMAPLIAARIARLSAASQDLAEIAASIGAAFDVEVLRDVSGWSEDTVVTSLDEMLDGGFIREPFGRRQFNYIFTHHLIQVAIYDASPVALRPRRHRRIARVLEELGESAGRANAVEVARHYELAGEHARAAANYAIAARQALAVYANETALAYARRAIELAGEGDDELRFDALTIAEAMNARIGDSAAQRADLEALEALTARAEDRERRCEVLRRWIAFHRTLGDRDAEAGAVAALAEEAARLGDARWQAEALEAEATHLEVTGNAAAALPVIQRAVERYETAGDTRGMVFALSLEAAVAAFVGEIADADRSIERARALAEASGDPAQLARVLRCESNVCHWTQRWSRNATVAREAVELARSVGDREMEATCLGAVAASAARAFRIREARDGSARAMEIFAAIGKPQGLATVCLNASALEIEVGCFAEAEALIERTEAVARQTNWRHGLVICAANRSNAACVRGDFVAARDAALDALAQAVAMGSERLSAIANLNLGAALRRLGDLPAAIERLTETAEAYARFDAVESRCEATAELALAHLAAGDVSRALALATDIARWCEAADAPEWTAVPVILWAAARVYHAAGMEAPSLELLARARARLDERARGFPDDDGRATYLAIPDHAAILASAAAHGDRALTS